MPGYEPTPTPPEAQEPLEPGQQVLINAFRGQLDALRDSQALIGATAEERAESYAKARELANNLLREQGINVELT